MSTLKVDTEYVLWANKNTQNYMNGVNNDKKTYMTMEIYHLR